MDLLTPDELIRVLREYAGEDEDGLLDGDVLDVPFEELGYDSLGLLNTVRKLERGYAIALPDDVLDAASTPRALLDTVNAHIRDGGAHTMENTRTRSVPNESSAE